MSLPRGDAWPEVRVVDAALAAAAEAESIRRGVGSRALMQRAGAAAAAEIARRYPDALRRAGATVYVGPGNNGGDGWVVVRALRAAGVRVQVHEVGEPKTEDARFERGLNAHLAAAAGPGDAVPFERSEAGREAAALAGGVHVDALLGTGASGAPRGAIAGAVERLRLARDLGGVVVALDLPSGMDASTGATSAGTVRADLTLTFGTLKRGLLVARGHAGEIVVIDIGLAHGPALSGAPSLVGPDLVRAAVPPIAADAHKGTRGRLLVIGGGAGMVGAAVLAARAAYRSGIGLVRLCVAPESVGLVQGLAPEAIAGAWPESDEGARDLAAWAQATLIGPGLGRGDGARALVERVLRARPAKAVLDADALNVFEGDADALGALLRPLDAVVTPHPTEFGRLAGLATADVVAGRFEVGAGLARRLHAVVLLKGVPTVLHSCRADAAPLVCAAGTPALAVGGSGDVLAGICATLLAQTDDPLRAAAAAAWVHGRAAELASRGRNVRGVTLDDVLARLGDAWPADAGPSPYPALATIPRI